MDDRTPSTRPPDRYCVFGNPIAHSRSPRIHALFAAQTGQHLSYEPILVEPGRFAAALHAFGAQGGLGANVTVPCKHEAHAAAVTRSDRAEAAQAVNTLIRLSDGGWHGDNTDGAGLVRDLTFNLGVELSGATILVLGAGGAASGIVAPLLAAGVESVTIANRTGAKAEALAARHGPRAVGIALPQLFGRSYDLIVNATSSGLKQQALALPPGLVAARGCCYDLSYGPHAVSFLGWARQHGAALCSDGLGMLVEQAAESFWLWRGVRPDTAPVIAELRRIDS